MSSVQLCGSRGVSVEFTVVVPNDNTHSGQFCQRRLYITQPSFHAENTHPVLLCHSCCCKKRWQTLFHTRDNEKKGCRGSEYIYIQPPEASQVIATLGGGGLVSITWFLSGCTLTPLPFFFFFVMPWIAWCECIFASHIHTFAELMCAFLCVLSLFDKVEGILFFVTITKSPEKNN